MERRKSGVRTTARMNEFPGRRVEVPLAVEVEEVGVPLPVVVTVVVGVAVAGPGRHCE